MSNSKQNLKRGIIIIRILLLFLYSELAICQETVYTLEQCINLGLENSLEIKIKQIEIKRTQKSHNSMNQC